MSLLQMSVTGGVMILAVTVIRALAMNRVPKKTFLTLWAAALLRLLLPVSLPSALSIYSLLRQNVSPAGKQIPAAVSHVFSLGQTSAVLPQTDTAPVQTISGWSLVWLAGLLFCAAFFALAYWRCCREFRMSVPVDNDAARQWLRAHPLRRKISIRQSGRVSSPLTFGVLHPVILMPKKTDWIDETSLQYILEHEYVHIRRFDMVSKLLLIAAACVHWFNPLVWVMYVLANRDMELSCDETVVRRFGSGARASYANVLICMEEARSGFAPLCNHFSRNAIEERITAIMKIGKITVISLVLAALLVAGTVTVFATSAKPEETGVPAKVTGAVVEQNSAAGSGGSVAVESGEPLEPGAEYAAAGIRRQENLWYYQDRPIAMIYDDNGRIYMDEEAADGVYLHVIRDGGSISDVATVTKQQFRELAGRHMNAVETEYTENTLMSYADPADGKTYYSFDGGKTFEPLTDAEFEARFPTPNVEWWTYDAYKAWLDDEKVQLQSMLGEEGWTNSDGSFVWTQEKIDETIALYESILEDIRNGILYSKTVDGQDDVMLSYNPADISTSTD